MRTFSFGNEVMMSAIDCTNCPFENVSSFEANLLIGSASTSNGQILQNQFVIFFLDVIPLSHLLSAPSFVSTILSF